MTGTKHSAERSAGCLFAMLTLCACGRESDWFAVPEQRPKFEDAMWRDTVIRVADAGAEKYFAADIFDPPAATWRLTGKKPAIRLHVPEHAHVRYHIEFSIPDASYRVNGPATITFLVNDHALASKQYTVGGTYEFEEDVPPAWIAGGDTTVGAEIDKTYSAKENGKTYGFVLVGIGLKRN